MGKRIITAVLFLAYVGCVFGANWAISTFGVVPVGFGLFAPAGVYFAGVAFSNRDGLQHFGGRKIVIAAILVGAALSALLDSLTPANALPPGITASGLAMGSALAFLLSELLDYAVYTPLARRDWLAAVVFSNTVGAMVDSAVFLLLVFHSLDFWTGQVLGKMYMTFPVVLFIALYRRAKITY